MEQCITFLFTWNPQQQLLPDVPTNVPGDVVPDMMKSNSPTSTSDAMAIEHDGTIYSRIIVCGWVGVGLSRRSLQLGAAKDQGVSLLPFVYSSSFIF